MRQQASFILFIVAILFSLNCGGVGKTQGEGADKIHLIPTSVLATPASAKKYENQRIRFKAVFDRIDTSQDWEGLEKFKTTHFLISLISPDKRFTLPQVLVPTSQQNLVAMQYGDMVQVEGVLHTLPERVYIVVTSVTKV